MGCWLMFFMYDQNHFLIIIACFSLRYIFKHIMVKKQKKTGDYNIRVRVWVDKKNKPFLGLGRVILLEKIKKHGSINAAAKSIKMSYRQAWQLVKEMNECAKQPVIEKTIGGANGGGTVLTAYGEAVIKNFYTLQSKIQSFIEKDCNDFII